jgi:hypothetical protein
MEAAEGIDPVPERAEGRPVTNRPDQRPDPAHERGALDTVVVTGLSGAGRSTAAKCLEDLGYFVVDNLPPELVATMVQLGSRTQGAVTRIAVVMDVRSRAFSADLRAVILDLAMNGMRPRVLFLEARDEVLVRRFENNRRAHPLQADGRLIDGIVAERRLLAGCATRPTSSSIPAIGRCMTCAGRSSGRLPPAESWAARSRCERRWCRSGTSTASRSMRIWWWTSASCPIRSGFPSFES